MEVLGKTGHLVAFSWDLRSVANSSDAPSTNALYQARIWRIITWIIEMLMSLSWRVGELAIKFLHCVPCPDGASSDLRRQFL